MIVLYFILLVISFAFYILYDGVLSFYLFGFLLILPIILRILISLQKKRVLITFTNPHYSTIQNRSVNVTIKVENKSLIPISNIEITMSFSMLMGKKKEKLKINSPVFPRDTQFLTLNISSEHCGTAHLKITGVKIRDMLRIFNQKIPAYKMLSETSTNITVFPEIIPLENETDSFYDDSIDSNVYSKTQKGDDPSEIFDIREYEQNDKINRIHWKLSAKQEKTMVKDYSLPITSNVNIMLDFHFSQSTPIAIHAKLFDAIITLSASISTRLFENGCTHRICWFSENSQQNVSKIISDETDIEQAMTELLAEQENSYNGAVLFNQGTSDLKCSHLIFLTSSLSEELLDLLEETQGMSKCTVLYINFDTDPVIDPVRDNISVVYVNVNSALSDISEISF